MCMLSRPIKDIAATNIFVNDLSRGMCGTVYSMEIETAVPVAMILPVPVLHDSGDDALSFVDLSEYHEFFTDMDSLFPAPVSFGSSDGSRGISHGGAKTLQVHQVGAFKASYVPTFDDFNRLDEQFRLNPAVWSTLPDYKSFGFAVFQFDPGAKKRIHPMAYKYPASNPTELFFPTVHVHDGRKADTTAHFDHKLYYQQSANFADVTDWEESWERPDFALKIGRTKGLVRNTDPIFRKRIKGTLANADQLVMANGTFCTHEQRGARTALPESESPKTSFGGR